MSGFKRMQSKVFWGQMAAQDAIESSPLIGGISASSSVASLPNAYSNFGMRHDDSETSLRDSDASDGNVTAIRVSELVLERDNQPNDSFERKRMREEVAPDTREKSRDAADGKSELAVDAAEVKCSSTASPCNRSLDSGFSDSERSNSPDVYDEDGTPKRQRRRRRAVTRGRAQLAHRIHSRLSSLWKDSDLPPNPAHTSTPKSERHPKVLRASRRMQPKEIVWPISEEDKSVDKNRYEEDQESSQAVGNPTTLEDECLGDFLYASEPPEDEDVNAIANVSPIASTSILAREGSSSRIISWERSYVLSDGIDRDRTALRAWLSGLVMETEDECGATLQSKNLPRREYREAMSEQSQTRDLRLLTSSATAAATELLVRADGFTRHLDQIVEKLSTLENGRSDRELLRSVEDEAFSILSELGAPPPRRIQQGNLRSLLSQLDSLRSVVDSALDARLDFYIERVVRGLEEAPQESGSAARGALAALTALGLAGNRAGSAIARCSGIRALLTSLVSSGRLSSDLRASSLRALASVCCCRLAIEQFVEEGGPEILLDLLAGETTPEREKMEAAALVVQITAPWTNALGLAHLEVFARDLVVFLTRLAESTNCSQTLLLAAAALNNLADSRKFIGPIVAEEAVRKLLKCVKKSSGGNVWLMEQVASLIGKLAKIPEARTHLAAARASVALVSFLRMVTPGLEDAYRRLELTATQALTRLCVHPEIARQVVALGGADCLPNLSYDTNSTNENNPRNSAIFRYTKSLRRACKHAARQIDVAKACDYSIRD
ncbi:protein inscuteable homolog isoform X2 [Venturia canescens]|uniref:protein inscuteable homolog isoform X2 n=1 Tax=Venturia canescens TaxID=32260 RepID=UPI001C9D351E|nr:protein inscuteable homolog isoform X2 [Venturia canescens]